VCVLSLRLSSSSHILANLVPPALFSVLSVLLLVLYDTFRAASWPALHGLGLGPLGLSSSALSLLLVFRTNTSYQRFDGAPSRMHPACLPHVHAR
jgi:predicted membrane chloride channel (bestrophin family)